ncbi:benzoate/H(+) symporter BenE family transporter [Ferrovibrio sp.]|uniref:benzoate/H(+) symporter BenE family transporter n=1 Tax=Ferrovibrio sp. TaxID=1917215 RepID=UPI0035B37AD9
MTTDTAASHPTSLTPAPLTSAIAAGLLSAFVGFASSFAVILQGLTAVGASQAQAASGLMALSLAMGLCAIVLSWKTRLPISIAWSTPGGALLASSAVAEGGFSAAVGAFIACGILLTLAGLWKPLGRAVAAIPAALANAMLAGILLGLCLAPVKAVAAMPVAGLSIVIVWALVAKWKRLYAMPAAVLVTLGFILAGGEISADKLGSLWPQAAFIMPAFSPSAMLGIALPLFIVTMASQNIPGIAVLQANGYKPDPTPLFRATGLFSLAAAPFGGHAVNLAAITAAICAGPEAHPDPNRRWVAALVAGIFYVVFGLLATAATAVFSAAPPLLIQAVAGLALLGAFASSLVAALSDAESREAAAITFIVAASGLTLFGIGGAFWGLIAGGAMLALARWRRGT